MKGKKRARRNSESPFQASKYKRDSSANSLSDTEMTRTGQFDKKEVVRILAQALSELGLKQSAKTVQEESGVSLSSEEVEELKWLVLHGDWASAVNCINKLNLSEQDEHNAIYLIHRREYFELLAENKMNEALIVLRKQLAPLITKNNLFIEDTIVELSSLMLCSTADELTAKLGISLSASTRLLLFEEIQKYIPAELILPSRRWESLFRQAQKYQIEKCLYHTQNNEPFSLYYNHQCKEKRFPWKKGQILEGHLDEVWYISFSSDGQLLASGSKDGKCIVWTQNDENGKWKSRFIFNGHSDAVAYLSWSPNNKMLLTCSNDHRCKLWNVLNGNCILTLNKHEDAVTACAWFPDSQKYVTGSVDQTIYLWNLEGQNLYKWQGYRTVDMNITGNRLYVACQDETIRCFSLDTKENLYEIHEKDAMTSMTVLNDKYALVNVSSQEIHIWDLSMKRVVKTFQGHKQGKYIIRSCFGGFEQSFVYSGSENNIIYVWHSKKETLIEQLEGHSATVNSVTWNPSKRILASGSDDHKIIIWEE